MLFVLEFIFYVISHVAVPTVNMFITVITYYMSFLSFFTFLFIAFITCIFANILPCSFHLNIYTQMVIFVHNILDVADAPGPQTTPSL